MNPVGDAHGTRAVDPAERLDLLVLSTSRRDSQRVVAAVFVRREARWRVAQPALPGTHQRVEQSGLLAVHTVGVRGWSAGHQPSAQAVSDVADVAWWTLPAHGPPPDQADVDAAAGVASIVPMLVVLTGARATTVGHPHQDAVRRARWLQSLELPFTGPVHITNAQAGYPRPGPVHGIDSLRSATLAAAPIAAAPLLAAAERASSRGATATATAWLQTQARRLRHASDESRALLDDWLRR